MNILIKFLINCCEHLREEAQVIYATMDSPKPSYVGLISLLLGKV